jgi:flagellar operon protein
MGYRVINGKLHLIGDFKSYDKAKNTETKKTTTSFKDVLEKQINTKESFVISNHAAERLRQRNISFNETDMKNINEGINKAEEKGCQESLILYKDTALITSIKNRTIITAVDKESSKGNVFTNIDSVIMI